MQIILKVQVTERLSIGDRFPVVEYLLAHTEEGSADEGHDRQSPPPFSASWGDPHGEDCTARTTLSGQRRLGLHD
jgi:hypothetical protein